MSLSQRLPGFGGLLFEEISLIWGWLGLCLFWVLCFKASTLSLSAWAWKEIITNNVANIYLVFGLWLCDCWLVTMWKKVVSSSTRTWNIMMLWSCQCTLFRLTLDFHWYRVTSHSWCISRISTIPSGSWQGRELADSVSSYCLDIYFKSSGVNHAFHLSPPSSVAQLSLQLILVSWTRIWMQMLDFQHWHPSETISTLLKLILPPQTYDLLFPVSLTGALQAIITLLGR